MVNWLTGRQMKYGYIALHGIKVQLHFALFNEDAA